MDDQEDRINSLVRIGTFTSLVFVGGGLLMFWVWMMRGWTLVRTISHPYIGLQFFIALLFYLSTRSRKLYFIQPAIFLVIAPINFLDSHDSFYGLGFFVMAVLLLFKIGFFTRHRIPKFISLFVYLYGWELFAAFRSGRYTELSLTPVFFVTVFLLYLYILYKEKIIVYLNEPKPVLDLRAMGLSQTERLYIAALGNGRSFKEVALERGISESTIRNSLARAYKKLGVKNRAELTTLISQYTILPD